MKRALDRPLDLRQRINVCRVKHQQAPPLAAESQEQLGIEAFVAMQSRGLLIAPDADPRAQPFRARGAASSDSASASSTCRAPVATTRSQASDWAAR